MKCFSQSESVLQPESNFFKDDSLTNFDEFGSEKLFKEEV